MMARLTPKSLQQFCHSIAALVLQVNTNITAVALLTQIFAAGMVKRERGHIVNVSPTLISDVRLIGQADSVHASCMMPPMSRPSQADLLTAADGKCCTGPTDLLHCCPLELPR